MRNLTAFLFCTGLVLSLSISCQEKDSPIGPPKSISYLALGDSYTIGEGVAAEERWPNQLVDSLRVEGIQMSDAEIIAQTGWTTAVLLDALSDAQRKSYDMVSLLIGVNDQYQNRDFELFQSDFNTILERSIQFAGGKERVFVLSIPDYGVTPFGAVDSLSIATELNAYNTFIRSRCEEEQIMFVDITGISRGLGDGQGALAPDNLHPSGHQYREWMRAAYPVARAIIY